MTASCAMCDFREVTLFPNTWSAGFLLDGSGKPHSKALDIALNLSLFSSVCLYK